MRQILLVCVMLAACACKSDNSASPKMDSDRQTRRLHSYAQEISTSEGNLKAQHDATFQVDLVVKNTGPEPWPAGGQPGDKAGWVDISYRWLDASGGEMLIEGKRTLLLPREMLRPGESANVKLQVVAPPNHGNFTLRISMVHEGITWFYNAGGKPLDMQVAVD
jgi:hypothetical protein